MHPFLQRSAMPQTRDDIATPLDAGYPAWSLADYRGGVHDWVTLAFRQATRSAISLRLPRRIHYGGRAPILIRHGPLVAQMRCPP